MTKEEIESIVELFSFERKQRNLWEYLDKYSILIEEWLNKNDFNDEQLVRFMLIGLFPLYRASVHGACTFTTDIEKNIRVNLGIRVSEKKLFEVFNQISEEFIQNSQHYLKLLNLSDLRNVTGDSFFEFVINGTPIG